jgi:hypothetical protein
MCNVNLLMRSIFQLISLAELKQLEENENRNILIYKLKNYVYIRTLRKKISLKHKNNQKYNVF